MPQIATIAITNAAWTYLIDGKLPNNTLDYLVPFANARGIARVLIPGQEKEYYDWQKIAMETFAAYNDRGAGAGFQQLGQSVFKYGEGKIAPAWQAVSHFFTGEDAIGHKIAWTPKGLSGWLADEFLPIFVNSSAKAQAAGLNALENLLGIREAPSYLADAQKFYESRTKLHTRYEKDELQRAGREAIAVGEPTPEGYKATRQPTFREWKARQANSFESGFPTVPQGVKPLREDTRAGAAPQRNRSEEQLYFQGAGDRIPQPSTTVLRGNVPPTRGRGRVRRGRR